VPILHTFLALSLYTAYLLWYYVVGSRPIVAISFYFLIFFPGLDGLLLPPPPALDGKALDSWETSIDCISLLNLLPICFYCAEINIDYSAQIANSYYFNYSREEEAITKPERRFHSLITDGNNENVYESMLNCHQLLLSRESFGMKRVSTGLLIYSYTYIGRVRNPKNQPSQINSLGCSLEYPIAKSTMKLEVRLLSSQNYALLLWTRRTIYQVRNTS